MKSQELILAEHTYTNLLKICYVFNHVDQLIPLWTEMKAMKHIEISRPSYFYMLQGLSKLALKDKTLKTEIRHLLQELNDDMEKIPHLREERLFSSVAKALYATISLEVALEYINTTFAKYHISVTFSTYKALFKIACLRLDEKEIDALWNKFASDADTKNVEVWSWRLLAYTYLYKLDRVLDLLEGLHADFRFDITFMKSRIQKLYID
jgi:hypothetical protein